MKNTKLNSLKDFNKEILNHVALIFMNKLGKGNQN